MSIIAHIGILYFEKIFHFHRHFHFSYDFQKIRLRKMKVIKA